MDAIREMLAERVCELESELRSHKAAMEGMQNERNALAAKLKRHSMDAGHAEQRRAESRAVRKALGFEEDADDVSPRDLLDALAHLKAQWAAHVERLAKFVDDAPYMPQRHMDAERMKLQSATPTTSLAWLKAQWQAEALTAVIEDAPLVHADMLSWIDDRIHELRQQTQEPAPNGSD